MEPNTIAQCVFCGRDTEERHRTSIGLLHIHAECLSGLEEALAEDEQQVREHYTVTRPQGTQR